jgi:hypothetical protein
MQRVSLSSLILLACLAAGPVYGQACSSPAGNEADRIYNYGYHTWQFCNGTSWRAFAGALYQQVSAGSGCTNPIRNEGDYFYNYTYHTYQFCNGTNWEAFGAASTPSGGPTGSGYFVLTQTEFNGCFGVQPTSMTYSGTTATVTTTYNHYLSTGNSITISGASPSAYNGTFSVTVTSPTTFTYTMGSNPGSNATTVGAWCYPTTGLAGANALCLKELPTNTGWWGYLTAQAAGLLTSTYVTAFLCSNSTCNEANANTTYYFASAYDSSAGGGSFTTNSSGLGPNDSLSWVRADHFGGTYLSNIPTGRGTGSSSLSDLGGSRPRMW